MSSLRLRACSEAMQKSCRFLLNEDWAKQSPAGVLMPLRSLHLCWWKKTPPALVCPSDFHLSSSRHISVYLLCLEIFLCPHTLRQSLNREWLKDWSYQVTSGCSVLPSISTVVSLLLAVTPKGLLSGQEAPYRYLSYFRCPKSMYSSFKCLRVGKDQSFIALLER